MATLEELLAERERRATATAPATEPEPMDADALIAEKARREQAKAQEFEELSTEFPMEPGTSRAAQELPELTDVSGFLEGREQAAPSAELEAAGLGGVEQAVTGAGEELSQAWLDMTTLDPNELAQQISTRFPDVGVQWAPDGTVIIANNKTGKKVAVNKPGMSPMDVLQTIGLIGAYSPMTRMTAAVSGLGKKVATSMLGAGATETALQAGQEVAGGEFDEADIAIATGMGALGELGVPVVTGAFYKLKGAVGKLEDIVPQNITQALAYAKEMGAKVTTSDALQEYLTTPMRIFVNVAERVPFIGLGGQRVKQIAQRADALSKLAAKYDINIDSDLGREIAESFVDRMKKRRFWGKNKEPTQEMLERAFVKEGDEITDTILSKYIRKGNIDEEVVDKVLDSGRTARITQMFEKFTPEGQAAAKQRFVARALDDAGWTPEGPQFSNPEKFMNFLDKAKNRKAMNVLFTEEEKTALTGAREFIRVTNMASKTGKGAGMTAAMATGAGFYFMDMVTAGIAGVGTAVTARTLQSEAVRNLLLRLSHAKGNPKTVESIMNKVRSSFISMGEQLAASDQGEALYPDFQITPDMVKGEKPEYEQALDYLRSAASGAGEEISDAGSALMGMLRGANQGSPQQAMFPAEEEAQ